MIVLRRLILAWLFILLPLSAIASPSQDREELVIQGQRELAEGHAAQAALIFEQVILEQPWRLGVWMDYALALQLSDDTESAQAIYRHLLTENPPEYLRLWLTQQVQQGPSVMASWASVGTVTLLLGHDSNLNRAPSAGTLALTYPFGSVIWPLANRARAQTGAASLLGMNWEAKHRSASGSDWSIQAGLSARSVPGTQGEGYLQPSLGVTRHWGGNAEETLLTMAYQQLQYGGQDLQHILRAGIFHGQPWRAGPANCSMLYGAEWKSLTYPSSTEINGRYLGIAASLGCIQGVGWNVLAHAGVDQAARQRAGGNQQQIDLRTQIYDRLGKGQWIAEIDIAYQRDSVGYSELLENNSVRDIRRGSLSLEYAHPLNENTQGIARIEAFRQGSSLALFDTHGQAAWAGIRYKF